MSSTAFGAIAHASGEPASYYTWSAPGVATRIRMHLDVIRSIQQAAVAVMEQGTGEIGGLLIGPNPIPGLASPNDIEITGFQLLPSRSLKGWEHKLLPQDVAQSEADLERAVSPQRIVGYFRTQGPVEPLFPRDEELEWANQHLSQPHQVLLLIQDTMTPPLVAAFFLREGDTYQTTSPLEFPFDADQLRPGAKPPAKNENKTGTVPVALLRPAAASAPLTERPARSLPHSLWPVPKAAFVGIGSAILLGGLALAIRSYTSSPRTASAPATPVAVKSRDTVAPAADGTQLSLDVRAVNRGLQLAWHLPPSVPAKDVVGGRLLISEAGKQPRQIDLGADQVRQGQIYYQQPSGQIEFNMLILSVGGERLKGSMLVIGPERASIAGTNVTKTDADLTARLLPPSTPAPTTTRSSPSVRILVPPTRASEARNVPLPSMEAPPTLQSSSASQSANLLTQHAVSLPGAPAAPAMNTTPPPMREQRPASVNQTHPLTSVNLTPTPVPYHAPVPVQQVWPKPDRDLWKRIHQEMAIEVRVRVSPTGRVTKAFAVRPPQGVLERALFEAASQAAYGWRYTPGTLGDKAVESDHTIRFVFHPQSR